MTANKNVETSENDAPVGEAHLGRSRYFLFGQVLFFSVLALIASFVLSYDAILLAANPDVELSCSINVFIDCAKVGLTPQANVFGFPNAFIGIASMSVLVTIAVASLGGSRFPRWFMFVANLAAVVGLVFAYWMLYQSTFVIGALCPWCLLVLLCTTVIFFALTHWNMLENNLYLSPTAHARAVAFAKGGWVAITLIAWLAIVVAVEAVRWLPAIL